MLLADSAENRESRIATYSITKTLITNWNTFWEENCNFTYTFDYCKNLQKCTLVTAIVKNLHFPSINLLCKLDITFLFYKCIVQAQSFQVSLNLLLQQISQVHYLNEKDETNANLANCIKLLNKLLQSFP